MMYRLCAICILLVLLALSAYASEFVTATNSTSIHTLKQSGLDELDEDSLFFFWDFELGEEWEVWPQDTWRLSTDSYHSFYLSWNLPVIENQAASLLSPPVQIPIAGEFERFILSYWVWCDMPDWDGDENGFIEDYYQIQVINMNTNETTMLGYEYADGWGGRPSSLEDWVQRDEALFQGMPTLLDLTPFCGETIRIKFEAFTDGNDDGGTGQGVFIDDVGIVGLTSLYDRNVEVSYIHIPFPATAGYPVPGSVTYTNSGRHRLGFNLFWQLNQIPHLFTQTSDTLEGGEFVVYQLDNDLEDHLNGWVPDSEGYHTITARLMGGDENLADDWMTLDSIYVHPEGIYELGYDNRNIGGAYDDFVLANGPFVHFTIPENLDNYHLASVKVLFGDDIPNDLNITAMLIEGEELPGELIWSGNLNLEDEDLFPNWYELEFDRDMQNSHFWVGFQSLRMAGQDGALAVHGDNGPITEHSSSYFYDGATLGQSPRNWLIRAMGTADFLDVQEELENQPKEFSLVKAWPNPFNSSLKVSFNLKQSSDYSLIVYDLNGREVLSQKGKSINSQRVVETIDASKLSSGVYFLRILSQSGVVGTKKIVLLK